MSSGAGAEVTFLGTGAGVKKSYSDHLCTSGPPFFRDSAGIPFESFALSFCLASSSHQPNLF